MTSPIDIYRTANELIKQHGEDAPIHAASRYRLPTTTESLGLLWPCPGLLVALTHPPGTAC